MNRLARITTVLGAMAAVGVSSSTAHAESWQRYPGSLCVTDIASAPYTNVALGCTAGDGLGNHPIFASKSHGPGQQIPGNGLDIAAGGGEIYVASAARNAYYNLSYIPDAGVGFDEFPNDTVGISNIAGFGDGTWLIGGPGGQFGQSIYRRFDQFIPPATVMPSPSWVQVAGQATKISVATESVGDVPWVINSAGTIFKFIGATNEFEPFVPTGCATDIAVVNS